MVFFVGTSVSTCAVFTLQNRWLTAQALLVNALARPALVTQLGVSMVPPPREVGSPPSLSLKAIWFCPAPPSSVKPGQLRTSTQNIGLFGLNLSPFGLYRTIRPL